MKKNRRKMGWILGIVVLLAVGSYFIWRNTQGVVMTYEKVEKGLVEEYFENDGVTRSTQSRVIYSTVTGVITDCKIQEGDGVQKDQILITVDQGDLSSEIVMLQSQMKSLKYAMNDAIKPADQNLVNKSATLYENAKIAYEEAKLDHEKSQSLYNSGAVSKEAYEASLTALNLSYNNLKIAESDLKLIEKKISPDVKGRFKAELEVLNTQLKMLENQKTKFIIKGPFNGSVTEKFVEEGQYIVPGTLLMEVTDLSKLYIESEVLDTDAAHLKIGQNVKIDSEESNVHVVGKVKKIHPKAIDKVSDLGVMQKRVKVELTFDGKNLNLRLNQDLDLTFVTRQMPQAVRVKKENVFERNNHYYVLVNEYGILSEKFVKVALMGNEYVAISEGLKVGDTIIVNPGEVKIGQRIK